ncbi:ABC transporter substrate-binding protein [Orenia marismortui]|uniref:ABC transporter substrate-binding protein n=1 Tax=Orenia marismortui TaxID=46469 RepID=UPI000373C991|nr:sugar ABC transporter substrate-binding protein [Orenia marismortui]
MKKDGLKNLVIMGMLVFVLLLSACSSKAPETSQDSSNGEKMVESSKDTEAGQITLKVSSWADEAMVDVVIPAFEKKYPNIKVEPVITDIADHHNTLLTKIAAGAEVPDVAYVEIAHIGKFAAKGGFEDLNQAPYNAQQFKDGVVSYAWAQATTQDGKMVAMPTDIAPGTIFYRKDKLDELGVSIDDIKTMEDWIEVGKRFAKDRDGDGVNDQWLIADATNVYNMIAKSGEERYFDEEGNCIVDSPRFVKAFTMAKKVRDLGLDGKIGEWTNEWYATFKQGTALIAPSGAWLGGHIKNWIAPDTAGKWRVAELPNGMNVSWGGSFAGIPKDADHKDAAWKFIKFVATRQDIQLESFESADMFPSLTETYDAPIFDEEVEFYGGQKVRKLWAETAQNIPNVITNTNDAIARDILGSALTEVLENDKDPKKALTEAKQLIERKTKRR